MFEADRINSLPFMNYIVIVDILFTDIVNPITIIQVQGEYLVKYLIIIIIIIGQPTLYTSSYYYLIE